MDLQAPLTVTVPSERPLRPRLHCSLHYTVADPYTVQLRFPTMDPQDRPIMWSLSRELLTAGLEQRAGVGDVVVSPLSGHRTALTLRDRHAQAVLVLPTPQLREFLARTHQVVAAGAEAGLVDWDELARRLCGEC